MHNLHGLAIGLAIGLVAMLFAAGAKDPSTSAWIFVLVSAIGMLALATYLRKR